MKLDKVKVILAIIVALIAIIGTILTVDKYFAKSEDVEKAVQLIEKEHKELENKDNLASERLDISITDDQIFQQEQHLQQMKNLRIFEQRTEMPELTPMEKEAIKSAEERLDNLRIQKVEKIKRYEKME